MKIIVLSDTHGNTELLRNVIFRNQVGLDLAIHLGDNLKDFNEVMIEFPYIASLGVLGNCDFASMYFDAKTEGCFCAEKRRIFYTHGHKYNVDHGVEYLSYNAKFNNCDIALYGHTHVGVITECSGVTVINPGSLSRPRDNSGGTYAILEICGDNLKCKILEVTK